jgi:hypothetical protein
VPEIKTRKMLAFRHHPKECASEDFQELSGIAKILTQACTLIELDNFSACNRAQVTAPEKSLCSFSSNMYIQLQAHYRPPALHRCPSRLNNWCCTTPKGVWVRSYGVSLFEDLLQFFSLLILDLCDGPCRKDSDFYHQMRGRQFIK